MDGKKVKVFGIIVGLIGVIIMLIIGTENMWAFENIFGGDKLESVYNDIGITEEMRNSLQAGESISINEGQLSKLFGIIQFRDRYEGIRVLISSISMFAMFLTIIIMILVAPEKEIKQKIYTIVCLIISEIMIVASILAVSIKNSDLSLEIGLALGIFSSVFALTAIVTDIRIASVAKVQKDLQK